ncbi:MAG: type I methionyl aminopeptidase [Candidatus Omnitrophota bacterium]|jgi:methionyl aminopeptidase
MIALKSAREIVMLTQAAGIVKRIFQAVEPAVRPGVTTGELDAIAEKVIRSSKAEPAFKGYRGYPSVACISVNEEVVHGIPGPRKLLDGDLVSFDIGVKWDGFYADAARTWIAGQAVSRVPQALIEAARGALAETLGRYRRGFRVGDISSSIQQHVEGLGFGVVRDYVGHGIGRMLHEEPQVPNFGTAGRGPRIEPGLVLAIEPMVTEGQYAVEVLPDGWTVVTRDRTLASHYEDMIVFTEEGYLNLTGEL